MHNKLHICNFACLVVQKSVIYTCFFLWISCLFFLSCTLNLKEKYKKYCWVQEKLLYGRWLSISKVWCSWGLQKGYEDLGKMDRWKYESKKALNILSWILFSPFQVLSLNFLPTGLLSRLLGCQYKPCGKER